MSIYNNMPKMMKKLKKDKFENFFNLFEKENLYFFEKFIYEIENSTDVEKKIEEISGDFVLQVKNTFSNNKGKISGAKQADLNLFMIYYVFPLILKIDNPNSVLLVERLCKDWSIYFANNISYGTYEKIYGSFREKIFGIF